MERFIGERPPSDGREWEPQCARCGSSACHEPCDCDDGYDEHDCGEDSCCCAFPEPNVICDRCHGYGGWYRCMSSRDFCMANPLPGREEMRGSQIEWTTTDPTPSARNSVDTHRDLEGT